jgi:hypothetical protein
MAAEETKKPYRSRRSAKPKPKEERDIVLLCNPQAGGRWRELADILDSDEARHVRRILTDAIADIGPALAELGSRTQLVCIYGGDGTIYRILDRLCRGARPINPTLALIGGGTMNVSATFCGMTHRPGRNFRDVVRAYLTDQLLVREVPLLEVRQGDHVRWGFIFGIGPIVRILNEYETGSKGKIAALSLAARSLSAIWSSRPAAFQPILQEMPAEILKDGELLPYDRYSAVFCNITGRLNPGVKPFVKTRTRDTFHCAAYAVSRREIALMLPFLIRGRLPMDSRSLLEPVSTWKRIALSYLGKESFPIDPRYVNDVASSFEVRAPQEKIYTIDGEILTSTGDPIQVSLGPVLKLVVSPTAALAAPVRLAADMAHDVTTALEGSKNNI